ncbi:TIR domain-containing protein [Methylophilus sp.]|uniref:TIR domain-containing protein n=1 Tax=Methylophilus sp. TaxID=29541 RepID=UPI0040364CC5
MARRVFYSFDYESDCWRASMVRNIGVVEGNQAARDNTWESVKRGDAAAIMDWIDEELNGRSCTIVLIGAETASSRWVNYEIAQSLDSGKGMFGIRIHRLLDQNQQESVAGPDPFTTMSLPDGRQLSTIIPTYDPPGASSKEVYAHISEHLQQWIEAAIANRLR